jgi:hypothetical protein
MLIKLGFKYKMINYIKEMVPVFVILIMMVVGIALYPFSVRGIILTIIVKCVYLGVIFVAALFLTGEYKHLRYLIKR